MTALQQLTKKIHAHVPELLEDTRGFDVEAMAMGGVPRTIGKITEHPITLEHVLKAIEKQGVFKDEGLPYNAVSLLTLIDGWFAVDLGTSYRNIVQWNVGKPLSEQSEDTIKWLNEIIV